MTAGLFAPAEPEKEINKTADKRHQGDEPPGGLFPSGFELLHAYVHERPESQQKKWNGDGDEGGDGFEVHALPYAPALSLSAISSTVFT